MLQLVGIIEVIEGIESRQEALADVHEIRQRREPRSQIVPARLQLCDAGKARRRLADDGAPAQERDRLRLVVELGLRGIGIAGQQTRQPFGTAHEQPAESRQPPVRLLDAPAPGPRRVEPRGKRKLDGLQAIHIGPQPRKLGQNVIGRKRRSERARLEALLQERIGHSQHTLEVIGEHIGSRLIATRRKEQHDRLPLPVQPRDAIRVLPATFAAKGSRYSQGAAGIMRLKTVGSLCRHSWRWSSTLDARTIALAILKVPIGHNVPTLDYEPCINPSAVIRFPDEQASTTKSKLVRIKVWGQCRPAPSLLKDAGTTPFEGCWLFLAT